jgi:ubiquinone/menaquinone biosynthesis C-methylase UbiE
VKAYYHARADEYDDWWLGRGLYADRVRPGWEAELETLAETIRGLPPKRTLDVACGTGFLTRHLPGEVTGLDQSEAMVEIARRQAPGASYQVGDALAIPFPDNSFDRVFASYFYCHLKEGDRVRFLGEARRVAPELVITGSAVSEGVPTSRWENRTLKDGSRWQVYKRYFTGEGLVAELGGGTVLLESRYFVVVCSP